MKIETADVFDLGEPVPFSELPINSLFMVSGTLKVNKYWKTPKKNWSSYQTSLVCKKHSENVIFELMTDFPTPPTEVPEENMNMVVWPVKFNG